jgi:hypothetical protein
MAKLFLRVLGGPVGKLRSFREKVKTVKKFIKKDLKSKHVIAWRKRISLWRGGFTVRSANLYDFEKYPRESYLSDYSRDYKTPKINGSFSSVLNNKLIFSSVFNKFEEFMVKNYCLIEKGLVTDLTGEGSFGDIHDLIEGWKSGEKLVLKRMDSGGGNHFFILHRSPDGELLRTGEAIDIDRAVGFLRERERSFVSEFVEQHQYSMNIFPGSLNTIRLLTMWDYEHNRPFIAAAAHRFGTWKTAPLDNCTQGAISCAIELSSGTMSMGACYPKDGDISWHETHPDTGAEMKGVPVPRWDEVKDGVLKMAASVPFVPYVGWDVAITPTGFKVIEGNNFSNVRLFQIHFPLLLDPRVKAFYKRFGVI